MAPLTFSTVDISKSTLTTNPYNICLLRIRLYLQWLQRWELTFWALTLSAYNYDIVIKSGRQNANVNVLSPLSLANSQSNVPLPEETVLLLENLQLSPVITAQIKGWTNRDPVLSKVQDVALQG